MELNRRLQRVVEVLPTGPASPIWDLDGTDSPIASEACPMSTMSDLVSSESNIGCSSPGLSSSSLLPDPCLGGIVDLGDGLHGDGGLFDTAQVSCTFSVPHDTSVTSLEAINTGLDPCDDSSDTLKHSVVSYNLSECNTDILGCVKDSCDKTSSGLVFSDQSSLAVGDDFSKMSDGSVVDDLQGSSDCLGLPSDESSQQIPSTCETIPAAICVTSSQNITGFNLPVLLSPSSNQTLPSNVTGALTVINLNFPLVASTCSQPSNNNNCAVLRVGQQNLALTNLVVLPGQATGAPAVSTAFTVPPCNLVTALPCMPQTTPNFTDQYQLDNPIQSSVSDPSINGNRQLQDAVPLPMILNSVPAMRTSFPLVSSVCESPKTANSAHSPISTSYDSSFDSTCSGSTNDQNIEMDTNCFLNLDADCLHGASPLTTADNGESISKSLSKDGRLLPNGTQLTCGQSVSLPTHESMTPQLTTTTTDTSKESGLEEVKTSVPPQNGQNCDPPARLGSSEPEVTPEEGFSPELPHTSGATSLSVTSFVQLIPAKKPPHIFKCDLCSATFNRLGNYSRHRMIHTVHVKDDYRYKCEQCDRMFLQKCDLKRHQLIHAKQEPYQCTVCSKGYIRKSDLRVHMRFHNGEKAFKCSYCPKNFYQSGDLNRHVRTVHLQTKMLTCGHCDQPYGYATEATLIRHMQTKHKDIIRQSLKQKLGASMEAEDKETVKGCSGKGEVVEIESSVQMVPQSVTPDPTLVSQCVQTARDVTDNTAQPEKSEKAAANNSQRTVEINNTSSKTVLNGGGQTMPQESNIPVDLVTHNRIKTS